MTKEREKRKIFEELKEIAVKKLELEAQMARIVLEQSNEAN